jgi:penicillin-binding protein 1C
MTLFHGREAVLAQYLSIVPYGNRIHGIAYAARRYLDKPVEDLSWAETAFLAAIPQSPARMNPFHPEGRGRAVERGRRILDRLLAQGILTPIEHELAARQIGDLEVPPAGERPRDALHAILRLERSLSDPRLKGAFSRRPVVTTTLDLDLQKEVAWQVFRAVEAWQAQGARNAAAIVLDRRTNAVLACVGSSDYFDAEHAGSIDYSAVPRSPGSALKPFVYALALERGTITPATILDDLERGAGGITNADELFSGPLLPRVALANSRNVPAANLLARVGVDEAYSFLRDLGLHDGAEPARRYGLGLAIGGMPVTLERLVRAYTVLSGDGRLGQLAWFPVAVKTGTSSRFRDAWAVAFTSRYVVGVWVGDPDFRPMNRLTGYRSAAELVRRLLVFLHRDQKQGLDDVPFPAPRGYAPVRLCALTGALAGDACEHVVLEWLRPADEPLDACRAHVRLAVDTRTGERATRHTPRGFVDVRTYVDLAPRYAAWAAAAGFPRPPAQHTLPLTGPEGSAALLPGSHASHDPRVSITSPESGLRLLRDPETPPEAATLALRATVDPPVAQVVWYVDGAPYKTVDYPYATRWRLIPGEHVIQARLAHTPAASSSVRVRVD